MADAAAAGDAPAGLLAGAALVFFFLWFALKMRQGRPADGAAPAANRVRSGNASPASWEYSPRVAAAQKEGAKVVKRSNMKGKPTGDIRGQAPDKQGEDRSYKKIKERRDKEEERCRRRQRRADRVVAGGQVGSNYSVYDLSAKLVNGVWGEMHTSIFAGRAPTTDEEKQVMKFYAHAMQGAGADRAVQGIEFVYMYDKYPLRADEMCCLLLHAHSQQPLFSNEGRPLRVVSLGGGPANDVSGAVVYQSIVGGAGVSAGIYDLAPSWGPLVTQVAGGLSLPAVQKLLNMGTDSVAMDFGICDLSMPAEAAVNSDVLDDAAAADLVLASYSLHESKALSHDLFAAVLTRARTGAVVAVLEVYRQVVLDACNLAESLGFSTHVVPNSSNTPFFGAYFVKK